MAAVTSVALLDHFAALPDPRQHAKVLYPLPEILLLVLSATLAGADDFVETTLWGTQHLAFLRRFYRYENGIPSHDTLCDVFAALDPELFKACFLAWVSGLRDADVDVPCRDLGLPRRFLDHGTIAQVRSDVGLTAQEVARRVVETVARLEPAIDGTPAQQP